MIRNIHIFGGESKAFTHIQLEVEFTSVSCTDGYLAGQARLPITFNDVYDFNSFIDANHDGSGIFIKIFKNNKEVKYETKT